MAIQFFKDIVDSKGYRINAKDRAIFETADLQSFFGLSDMDAIEFILYDANDNQLPQGKYGLVRYVTLNTQNISDYFLIADGTIFQANKFPTEYFVDAERLINEAGYNQGIFKTQITLINKRLGTEEPNRKVWISEISPSRTEVRLLPLKNAENDKTDLYERFGIFQRDGEFRDDTLIYILHFIDKINPMIIGTTVKTRYTEAWYNKLCTEYKISSFDQLITIIYNKFMEAALYEITNRISDIRNLNYGNPKTTKPSLQLTKAQLKAIYLDILIKCIDYYLSYADSNAFATYTMTLDESIDATRRLMTRTTTYSTFESSSKHIEDDHIVEQKQRVCDTDDDRVKKFANDCDDEFGHDITVVVMDRDTNMPVSKHISTNTNIKYFKPSLRGEPSVEAQSKVTKIEIPMVKAVNTGQFSLSNDTLNSLLSDNYNSGSIAQVLNKVNTINKTV